MPKSTPFDLAKAQDFPDWQRDLAWPITPPRLLDAFQRSLAGYLALAKSQDDPARCRLLLAVGGMIGRTLWGLQEYTLCIQEEQRLDLRLVSDAAELDFLRGEPGVAVPSYDLPPQMTQVSLPRYPRVRRFLTTREWTPAWRLPAALLASRTIAVSVNELLVNYAVTQRQRLRFREAGSYLVEARSRAAAPAAEAGRFAPLAERIAGIFGHAADLEEPYLSRMQALASARIEPILAQGQRDIEAFSRLPRTPEEMWSATGGKYAGRLLGLEVMARGGEVVRFDHGGTTGMTSFTGSDAMVEFCVSSRFVAGTPALAEVIRAGAHVSAEVVGHNGFPNIRKLRLPTRRPGPRRKVMYLASLSLSHRKNSTSSISELVYNDWSHRLTNMLAGLPIDLVIKPHPMSVPADGHHSLEALAEVSYRPFEEVMAQADVYVYDVLNSTTFWEALCTDRLVVFIDLGYIGRNPALETMFRQRCRVIEAHYDERNRPQVDAAELEAAVADGAERADPSTYRQLFLDGESEGPQSP